MPGLNTLVLFPLLVLLAYFVGCVGSFGGTILALAAVTWLVDLRAAVPALLLVGTVQALHSLLVTRRDIDPRPLARMVVLAGLGVPLGLLAVRHLNGRALAVTFALVSIASGLLRLARRPPRHPSFAARRLFDLLLVSAGVLHGAFAAGGAPVVVVAQHTIPRKETFRATLFMFWTLLNFTVVGAYLYAGRFTAPVLLLALIGLPAVLLATALGERAARRLPQDVFSAFVAVLLVIAGLITLARHA